MTAEMRDGADQIGGPDPLLSSEGRQWHLLRLNLYRQTALGLRERLGPSLMRVQRRASVAAAFRISSTLQFRAIHRIRLVGAHLEIGEIGDAAPAPERFPS